MADSWINVRFQSLSPHPLISSPVFRAGGSGETEDWPAILTSVVQVREAANRFLDTQPEPDLDRLIPYDGSIEFLRATGLSLRYAVMRIAAHHFIHMGEIWTVRSQLGHVVPNTPDWGRAFL